MITEASKDASDGASSGGGFQINTLDVVFTVANVSLLAAFGIVLHPMFLIIFWVKKKRKEAEEDMEEEYNEHK